jgi:hypothetical protein
MNKAEDLKKLSKVQESSALHSEDFNAKIFGSIVPIMLI